METNNNRMVKTLHLTSKGKSILDRNGAFIEDYTNDILNIYDNNDYKQFENYLDKLKDRLTESVDMVFE